MMCVERSEEVWRAIDGFAGLYEVSNLGRIRSLPHEITGVTRRGDVITKRTKGRVLRPHPSGKGYLSVSLSKSGVVSQVYVHRCVAHAFLGAPPAGNEVAHGNGDKTCNELWNLRYDTPAGNNADKRRHGTAGIGEANPRAKLNESAVRAIRTDFGSSQLELAARFGVSQTAISQIRSRKTWAHVL
ncbi:NUMOD4 domain-containing protein [Burkholderia glumae]|uniref:NUMOD4 domain-containing protein n=1 Tax=Burkholderia glumae TaxID=337 RepID=UPI002037214B|nr:NUMOD4 domain-containing protein [Burkholderia glumae]MCM2547640.1 NUMOD4 domain-containing protein [Burkholderia glumae]